MRLLLRLFFQRLQLTGHLFGLIPKTAKPLSKRACILRGGRRSRSSGGRSRGKSGSRRGGTAGQLGQGLNESIPVNQPVTHSQYDLFELRHTGFAGLDVDGLDVEKTASHRQSDNVSAQNVRALLVPQGQILGDVLVLVNA